MSDVIQVCAQAHANTDKRFSFVCVQTYAHGPEEGIRRPSTGACELPDTGAENQIPVP